MADEGEDSESLQGLLPPVNHSLETLGESELVGECGGLEGPFQTDQGSEESATETSDNERLCLNHHEEEGDREEVATVQQQQVVVGEAEVGGRPMASCDYRLQFSHGGELGGLLPVPEHGPLPTQEQSSGGDQLLEGGAVAGEMVMASSAASETVETHR